ncbi:MAG: bifunctional folylpolyglutamate synthase/dihydrofolate synthase [Bryobacteraceae bacterium]|nr:bifunctional folylpolyglutamate synthase/dihydrofolate synthase [Bryobacteraceae bacterium]
MNHPAEVQYLYSLGNEVKSVKLGLDRMRRMAAALDHPERACRYVHVAGTNGKGSTCAMIESALRRKGLSTGLYTSPHFVDPTERIQLNGKPISEAQFSDVFHEMHHVAEALIKRGELDMHPTYFESLTLMAFLVFRQARVNTVVLETGLGGRLDATNVVTPVLSVITAIDFDHMQWLGDTIELIATEKAGIIKPGVPVVVAHQRPEARLPMERAAIEHQAALLDVDQWRMQVDSLDAHGGTFTLTHHDVKLEVHCPLAGEHQLRNAATAAVSLHQLGLTPQEIFDGIGQAQWPGRLERIHQRPDVILDGAHNAAGAVALAAYIRHFHQGRRVWMIFGVMADKQVDEIAEVLFPLAHELILTAPDQARALAAAQIAQLPAARHGRVVPRVSEALAAIRQAAPEDVVFITGSLYLVGEARPLLKKMGLFA